MNALNTLKVVAVAIWVAVLPLRSEGQSAAGLPEADVRKITDVTEAFTKAVLSRDWKMVAALYADEAVLYPPGEAAVKGRAAIEACLTALPAMKDFKLRNTRVEGREDLAYVQGTYTMTRTEVSGSAPGEESGYFLEIRRRQPDGRWLIAVHMLAPHQ